MLIHSSTSTDVLFLDALKKIERSENDLKKVNFPLMGFASNYTYLVGAFTLPVYICEGWKSLTINITFIIVDAPTSNNVILGRSTLNSHQMVHSTYHQMMKFPTSHDIGS